MTKYIAMLAVGAMASIAAVQAGEQCCEAKKQAECSPQKSTASSAKGKATKMVKKTQATAKGGYRG